jgi:BCD family chlorophyll transporter-like MFS transporter
MALIKTLRLSLLHMAVAVTTVLATSVLNNIMINDLRLAASFVGALIALHYLLSPLRVLVGRLSDTRPILGLHRSPYIALGLVLMAGATALMPGAALWAAAQPLAGGLACLLVFALWGVGLNTATVTYLALATDLFGEQQRGRVVSIMWTLMIVAIIVTAGVAGSALKGYSVSADAAASLGAAALTAGDKALLLNVFAAGALVVVLLAALGLVGLEPRAGALAHMTQAGASLNLRATFRLVADNTPARRFFVFVMTLFLAIAAQDILLEPFARSTFGWSVEQTTRLTQLANSGVLIMLILGGFVLVNRLGKQTTTLVGASVATAGFALIIASALAGEALFRPGVLVFGLGTGLIVAGAVALMMDMTDPEHAGLFMGAWGTAQAFGNGFGTLAAGIARDAALALTGSSLAGYLLVFAGEIVLLLSAIVLLMRVDVRAFRGEQPARPAELLAATADA